MVSLESVGARTRAWAIACADSRAGINPSRRMVSPSAETNFSKELGAYLDRCRAATDLPLAVGFGVKDHEDVKFLHGKADIAVVGSQSIRILDEQGVSAVGEFVGGLVA